MKTFTTLFPSISIAFALFLLASPVYAADIAVSAGCSLANAITAANTDTATGGCPAGNGADTIALLANIRLQADLPTITSDMTIEGNNYTIRGNNRFRIFYIEDNSTVAIHDLTLAETLARYKGSHLTTTGNDALGGAIYNEGKLTISNSTFNDNKSDEYGGAIYSIGDITISDSIFSDNAAVSLGGAISNWEGTLTISNSAFRHNQADLGGAILNNWGGTLIISDSAFRYNEAASQGGAVSTKTGTVTISNTGFESNSAGWNGGAVHNWFGKTSISDSSFTGNSAEDGGAIYNEGTMTIIRSVIADNHGGDCAGTLEKSINNYIKDGSCPAEAEPLDTLVEPEDPSSAYYDHPGVIIEGSEDFIIWVQAALDLLKNNAPEWYSYADNGLDKVKEVPVHYGLGVDEGLDTFFYLPRNPEHPFEYDVVWLATVLVHEACHVYRSQAGFPYGTVEEMFREEVICQQIQIDSLEVIDPHDRYEFRPYLQELIDDFFSHGYQLGNSCTEVHQFGTRPHRLHCDAIEFTTGEDYCSVTTTHSLNFRDGPAGNIIGGVPKNTTHTALKYADGWFKVNYHNTMGWISADYVISQGNCS